MNDINKILLAGRLGNEPTRRETKNGLAVVNFSLATSRKVTPQDGGEPREETQWHKVVVWGKSAETCKQYLGKGDSVFVEGSMRVRKFTGKDGASRLSFEVHADTVQFLTRKRRPSPDGGSGGESQAAVTVAADATLAELAEAHAELAAA